jgi:murein DD-endopeptidase MepM/ murein hydrolase activator NlpD
VLTPPPKQAEKPIVLDLPKKPVPHAPKVQVHVIAVGETLYHIAHAYDVTVEALAKANHIEDPTTLAVGQRLVIPRPPESDAEVVPEREAPASTRRTARAATIGHVGGVLDWPLRGVLYARFGKKGDDRHEGIDLAAPKGTPVKTAAPGKVIFAGEQEGYGLMAIVQHTAGFITLYAHDNDLRVKTGQHVREGQVIATVGESGRTSGPHLHFEVRKDGKPVDPLLFLKPPPSS